MNKEEKVAYWLDIADYDMDTVNKPMICNYG